MAFPPGFPAQGWAFAELLARALSRGDLAREIACLDRHKTPKRSLAGLSKAHRRWYIPLAPKGICQGSPSQEASGRDRSAPLGVGQTRFAIGFSARRATVYRGVEQPGSSSGS